MMMIVETFSRYNVIQGTVKTSCSQVTDKKEHKDELFALREREREQLRDAQTAAFTLLSRGLSGFPLSLSPSVSSALPLVQLLVHPVTCIAFLKFLFFIAPLEYVFT